MRRFPIFLLAALVTAGCAGTKDKKSGAARPAPKAKTGPGAPPKPAQSRTNSTPTIEPVSAFNGRVVLVNAPLKYVVIEGVIGRLPPADQTLNVLRDGQKVGVVVVSSQSRGANFAADLTQGEVRVGDTVRSD
ncbi:MAG: hypothetical protein WCS99_12200 [Limisphaerales bacterium]|jgi:hypothetical protein